MQHDRMKHVNIDQQWIRENLDEYKIFTPYIGSSEQLVNVWTKGLSKDQFVKLTCKLGLMDIHSLACEGVLVGHFRHYLFTSYLPV